MNNSQRLLQLRAVVTGGDTGIGEAIARVFAQHGASVLAVDTAQSGIESRYASVKNVTGAVMDVADEDSPAQLLVLIEEHLGGVDVLVNNAGVSDIASVEHMQDEMWDHIMAVNLRAVFRLSRTCIPQLRKSPAGRIINLGSVFSMFGSEGLSAYVATKHAVAGLTKSMAAELGNSGITVNYIQPGAIMTDMTRELFRTQPEVRDYWIRKSAAKRLGEPLDVAKVALFLASDDAAFVSGTGIVVDGGAVQVP